jgi:hypothetical protein
MKVHKLMELLAECDPDAFVTVGLAAGADDYAARVSDTPPPLLWFHVEEQGDCGYSGFPHLAGLDQVVITASLDRDGLTAADADGDQFGTIIPPDFGTGLRPADGR